MNSKYLLGLLLLILGYIYVLIQIYIVLIFRIKILFVCDGEN